MTARAPGEKVTPTGSARPRSRGGRSSGKGLIKQKEKQILSQQQAAFKQAQRQDECYFRLRVAMTRVAICAIPAVIIICSLIIFDPYQDAITKHIAESTLFFSLIRLMSYVWRVFFNSSSVSRLRPVTTSEDASQAPADHRPVNQAVHHKSKLRRPSKGTDSR